MGNIKEIVITAENVNYFNDDWSIGSDKTTLTWSGTPASSVTLSSQPISIYTISSIVFTIEDPTVAVTSITLDPATASMTVGGETLTLTSTVLPANATDKSVTWTSSAATVATVTITAVEGSDYSGTASKTFTIAKAAGSISYAETSMSKTFGDADFTNDLTNTGDGIVTYASDNTAIATVNDETGLVHIVGTGEATIYATVTDGDNYADAERRW